MRKSFDKGSKINCRDIYLVFGIHLLIRRITMDKNTSLEASVFHAISLIILLALLLAFLPIKDVIAQDANPEAIIKNLEYWNGPVGFDIYLTLDVNHALNQSVWIAIWFKDQYGNGVVHGGNDPKYGDVAGFLTCQQEVVPGYEITLYDSYLMQIPYEEFPEKVDQLYAVINVTMNGQLIGYYESSQPINFSAKTTDDFFHYDNDDDQDGLDNQFEFGIMSDFKPKLVYDEEEYNILVDQDPQDFDQGNGVEFLYQVSPASCKLTGSGDAEYASFAAAEPYPQTVLLTIVAIYPYDYLPWKNKYDLLDWDEEDIFVHYGDLEQYRICLDKGNTHAQYEYKFIHIRRHGSDHIYTPDELETEFNNTSDHEVLYISEGKHATYGSADECEDGAPWYQEFGWDEDCDEGKIIWPDSDASFNVGEYTEGRTQTLADYKISDVFAASAIGDGKQYFEENVWVSESLAPVDRYNYFCGGSYIDDYYSDHHVKSFYWDNNCSGSLSAKWWHRNQPYMYSAMGESCLQLDTDRFGSDYLYIELPNPDPNECAKACVSDENCVTFAYVPPGTQGNTALCYLKNEAPTPAYMAGVVSGLRKNCMEN